MRFAIRLGVLLGSLHGVLYFLVPVYESYVSKYFLGPLSVVVMFFFGLIWPILVFLTFAPRRYLEAPDAQDFIRSYGKAFHLPTAVLPLRLVCFILLWPFSILNFVTLYEGLHH